MSLIQNLGNQNVPIWIIINDPYEKDAESGYLFSCGYGYAFKKILSLAGLSLSDVYISSLRPCVGASYDTTVRFEKLLRELEQFKPAVIVPLGDEMLNLFCPQTKQKKDSNSALYRWAGSILVSTFLSYPHYIIGNQPPDFVARNWDYHEVMAYIDLGRVKEEFEYFKKYGVLQPLPSRNLITEPDFSTVVGYLNYCKTKPCISVDIETLRPKLKSPYHTVGHPGYPYTIAIAPSTKEAISLSFWEYPPEHVVKIWRLLDELLSTVPQIGQNYFTFDSHYLESMGFNLCLDKCHDTMLRHHILWVGLPHKLQFLTKQYTREPYYKDELKTSKNKRQLMLYNAKDAAVTYEIWEEQEKEFNERPELK